MDCNDERDDLTDDEADVMAHRARARDLLNEIARQAKQALSDQSIDINLFFIVPSGNAVVTFGCSGDPTDDEWNRVAGIVTPIVSGLIGLTGTQCRAVACATTEIADQPSQPAVQPTGQAGCCSMPMHAPALQQQEQRADEIS
jgi:hypothetical protein